MPSWSVSSPTSLDGACVVAVSTPHRGARVKRFISAGLASCIGGVVDMAVLIELVETGTAVALAAFIAAAFGAVVHFAWSKYLAFGDRPSLAVGQMLRFAGVAV